MCEKFKHKVLLCKHCNNAFDNECTQIVPRNQICVKLEKIVYQKIWSKKSLFKNEQWLVIIIS